MKRSMSWTSVFTLLIFLAASPKAVYCADRQDHLENERPRLVVLTDIGGDPDDTQSMIRLMTYSNEFEIEGLIASASGTPGELKRKIVSRIRRCKIQRRRRRPVAPMKFGAPLRRAAFHSRAQYNRTRHPMRTKTLNQRPSNRPSLKRTVPTP